MGRCANGTRNDLQNRGETDRKIESPRESGGRPRSVGPSRRARALSHSCWQTGVALPILLDASHLSSSESTLEPVSDIGLRRAG